MKRDKFIAKGKRLFDRDRKNTGGAYAGVRDARSIGEAAAAIVRIQERKVIEDEAARVASVNDRLRSKLKIF